MTCTCTHVAGVAAVVHWVIDQTRVAAHGDPPARRAEVSFGRDGVLLITQVVADVGERLDQRNAEIRRIALLSNAGISSAMRSSISRRKLA